MKVMIKELGCAGLVWLCTLTVMGASAPRPNFLWLIAEDFGPALGCYGQKATATPNLDQLARDGVRYDRFYTTAPVCSPSRSAFMTGMYQTTIGAHHHRTANRRPLPEGVKILPDWLRAAGYFTANLRKLPEAFQFKGTGKTDWNFAAPEKPFDSEDWADLKPHQPFLAQINFHETHRKFNGERRADPKKVSLPPYYPDHPVTRQDYARYLDAAMEMDRKVGVILEELAREGLAENTVVVFMGDNGEAHVRGKQFCYEEGLRVPLIIRWPKAIPPPKSYRAGATDQRLLEAIDLAPTFLSLAGAEVPPGMQGRPFLGEQTGTPKQYVFGARDRCDETAMRIRTVRDKRYRYIRNFTPEVPLLAPNKYKETQYPVWNLLKELNAAGKLTPAQAALCAPRLPAEELYDMILDPDETNNLALAKAPATQHQRERLARVLQAWIKQTGDRGEIPGEAGEAATGPGSGKSRKVK